MTANGWATAAIVDALSVEESAAPDPVKPKPTSGSGKPPAKPSPELARGLNALLAVPVSPAPKGKVVTMTVAEYCALPSAPDVVRVDTGRPRSTTPVTVRHVTDPFERGK